MRFNQVLNHVTMSVIPYMNEIILGSRGYQNRIWALHDLTAGNKISPVNLKKGVAEGLRKSIAWRKGMRVRLESSTRKLVLPRTVWELGAFQAADLLPCPTLTESSVVEQILRALLLIMGPLCSGLRVNIPTSQDLLYETPFP